MRLELGKPVRCSDGVFGELADVVVDPTQNRVTHLVVRPHGLDGVSRLVPVELADSSGDDKPEISLRCALDDVQQLDYVQEYAYLRLGEVPTDDPEWDVGVESVLGMPYYSSDLLGDDVGGFDSSSGMIYDRVPKGEVEIRRTSDVTAVDGRVLGQVDGFVVDVGWGTYGFKAGPAAGEAVAELVATGRVPESVAGFTLSRFEHGRLLGEKGAAAVSH